jgi:erythromycin esterase
MAANVEWILDQNPGAKIVMWAHNGHVARQAFAMGAYLNKKFGKDHLPIGFATAKGEYQAIGPKGGLSKHPLKAPPADSFEAAFQRAGIPRFLLDLRSVEADAWLAGSRPFRMIGAVAMDQQFQSVKLPKQFDAVIYIEETTAAKPIKEF